MPNKYLPSWNPGEALTAIEAFLAASSSIDPHKRVAVFDNDGTLWCEKPLYPQLAFFVHELAGMAKADPALNERVEYAALLKGDFAAVESIGVPQVAQALAELFIGFSAEEFAARSQQFIRAGVNPLLKRPFAECIYLPMLELLEALRAHGFATFVVTGGGTEFVRGVSHELYGVPPEGVVGTLISYEYSDIDGAPVLRRTGQMSGTANEGAEKVVHIQQHLGRRPCFAAGNSAGDADMINWAISGDGPSLGILIDHDDAEREAAYASVAGTFETSEPIVDVGLRSGWTVVSMAHDWSTVFA